MIDANLPGKTLLPERLGSYRLEKRLGRGGMGEVFLAWDERLERHVAIKRILPDPPSGEQARTRFRREAKAVARLSHPAIVQVFELLETEAGDDCLVMEYIEGRGLAEVIAGGQLGLGDVLRLGAELADGLAEAHGKGLVHRDLKPENVRITTTNRAKILDFGLARLLWSEGLDAGTLEQAVTQSGALVGTVHAMSPEQASGRPVDHRSDLFALGGLLYEMLTGQAPFRGQNVLDMLRRITSEDPAPLAELRPGLPTGLVELVDSTRLVETLGDVRAAELSARHDRMARDLLARHGGLEIDKTDGFLLLFERPFSAVAYALAYHRGLAELSGELSLGSGDEARIELSARAGLHLGEVVLRHNPADDVARGAKPLEVEGLAKPMAARIMSLAGPRQTLLTHSVFDLTRRAAVHGMPRKWHDSCVASISVGRNRWRNSGESRRPRPPTVPSSVSNRPRG